MKRNLLLCMLAFLVSCKAGDGQLSDPPPSRGLSIDEARSLSKERSRQERQHERGGLTAEEEDNLPQSGPRPMADDGLVRTSTRPLTAEEQKLVHDALATCSKTVVSVHVLVEPGGVVFLAPGQRFLEADLACYSNRLGTVRLDADVPRKGTIPLP
ncbi:hypothetical protein KKC22_13065 [Myxococcota bacterium]|nr:hypothetical protein [Myxococcota bacterium]